MPTQTGRAATFQFNWVGELFDTIAKLSGKYGTWLGIKKNRYGFLVHSACCIYWIGIDIHRNLWSQALFTIPTVALQLYGFYKWGKDDKKPTQKLFTQSEVNKMLARERRKNKRST